MDRPLVSSVRTARAIVALMTALVMLQLVMIATPSSATDHDSVVDQQQPTIDSSIGGAAVGGQSQQILAQVVTAGMSGRLTKVRFPVACSYGSLTVEVRTVNDGGPTEQVVSSVTNHAVNYPSFGSEGPSFREIKFSTPVSITSGNRFAIVLRSDGECGVFQGPEGDPYPGGDAWFHASENDRWVPMGNPRFDLPFQTLVSPSGGSATPLPSGTPTSSSTPPPSTSPSPSASPTTSPAPNAPRSYERVVGLSLRRHLVARGTVEVPNGIRECAVGMVVKIQRRRVASWRTVTSTSTTFEGTYRVRISDRAGVYRALVPRVALPTEEGDVICRSALSITQRHLH